VLTHPYEHTIIDVSDTEVTEEERPTSITIIKNGLRKMKIIKPVIEKEKPAHDASHFKKKYRVGPEIGRGGFGVVNAGIRSADNIPVAIKFVMRSNVSAWAIVEEHKVPLEIALLYHCRTVKGVVSMLDWFERPDGYIIVMERPKPACDLFDFISDRGALDEPVARALFKQIVLTTIGCARKRVVHRDIKDENIIIDTTTGKLKLIDFGSGAFLDPAKPKFSDFEGKCRLLLFFSLFLFAAFFFCAKKMFILRNTSLASVEFKSRGRSLRLTFCIMAYRGRREKKRKKN
jgi:serine/threonine protein kinase